MLVSAFLIKRQAWFNGSDISSMLGSYEESQSIYLPRKSMTLPQLLCDLLLSTGHYRKMLRVAKPSWCVTLCTRCM